MASQVNTHDDDALDAQKLIAGETIDIESDPCQLDSRSPNPSTVGDECGSGQDKDKLTADESTFATFGWTQYAYMAFCVGMMVLLGYLYTTVKSVGPLLLPEHSFQMTFALVTISLWVLFPWPEGFGSAAKPADSSATGVQPSKPQTAAKARSYYLDRIKLLLVQAVTLHHVVGLFTQTGAYPLTPMVGDGKGFQTFALAFLGFNQSYFMPLFFFISGYFTPKSLRRKGTFNFMKDKVRRLGLPFFAYYFLLNPLLYFFIGRVWYSLPVSECTYIMGTGPPWFVAILLLFNIAYVALPAPAPVKFPFPSLWQLLLLALVIAGVQYAFVHWGFSLLSIPLAPYGSTFADILFFFGGCVACDCDWLTSIKKLKPLDVSVWWVLTVANIVAQCFILEATNAAVILGNIATVSNSICVLHMFANYFNQPLSKFTQALSQSAYTVYLIHNVLIGPVGYAWGQIVIDLGHEVNFGSAPAQVPNYLVWLGFLFASVVTTLIVWPLAFLLRKLPGLREIL